MKYFNPSYWFKLWVLSAPLFNDKTQGINAKSIDNKNIKDWTSNNTTDIALIENQEFNFTNNNQTRIESNLPNTDMQLNLEKDLFYENFLKTQGWSKNVQESQKQLQTIEENHHQFLKNQHEIFKNRMKREADETSRIDFYGYGHPLRGSLKFVLSSKKIIFTVASGEQFHRYYDDYKGGTIYYKVTIKDQYQKVIKYITFHSKNTMQGVINQYNLQNGINYQEGYIIELFSKEPSRNWFFINNNWKHLKPEENANWDWDWKFRIENNQIIEYQESKQIILQGLADEYKGEIGLDTKNKKIKFFGTNSQIHLYFDGSPGWDKIYNTINIYDKYGTKQKEIIINGIDTMKGVINKYNLQNGINYQEGYIIELWLAEPSRTKVFENGNWKEIANIKESKFIKKFIINNNQLINYKENLSNIILNKNLKTIIINDDKKILNNLNYLNPNLDVNQLKVTTKNDIEARIMPINNSNKYTGEVNVYYSINNSSNIIDFNELIKKAIFFYFRDNIHNSFEGKIKNLEKNNLVYTKTTITNNTGIKNENKLEVLSYIINSFSPVPYEHEWETGNYEYSDETTDSYEIKTGLIKTIGNTNTNEKSETKTDSQSIKKTEYLNWNNDIKIGFDEFFDFSFGLDAGISNENENRHENSTTITTSKTVNLENSFEFSNTEKHELKVTKKINFANQKVKVLPNQKAEAYLKVFKNNAKVFLNLTENIYGEINVIISSKNLSDRNFHITINELMQTLQKNNILPPEITINNNNTITFNGKMFLSKIQSISSKFEAIITNVSSTSQIVKRNVYKWDDNFIKYINNQQHLPISNNTNYIANNITSL